MNATWLSLSISQNRTEAVINSFQLLNEVVTELQSLSWAGSSTPVFHDDSIRVIGGDAIEAFAEGLIFPAALIRPGASTSDPLHGEEPDLIQFSFDVILIAVGPGDRVGAHPIMGAYRQGLTDSRGRGLLELEEELFNAVSHLRDAQGVRVQSIATGAVVSAPHDADNVIAAREYSFDAQVTADRFYHAPIAVTATDLGGGQSRIRWSDPPPRGDRIDIQIQRLGGPTAPANETQGTTVANVAVGVESYVDSPGVGEFSYTVFATYNDHGGSSLDRFSDAEQGTQATITVT